MLRFGAAQALMSLQVQGTQIGRARVVRAVWAATYSRIQDEADDECLGDGCCGDAQSSSSWSNDWPSGLGVQRPFHRQL